MLFLYYPLSFGCKTLSPDILTDLRDPYCIFAVIMRRSMVWPRYKCPVVVWLDERAIPELGMKPLENSGIWNPVWGKPHDLPLIAPVTPAKSLCNVGIEPPER